ncbi:MAG: acyltransferase [Selenomonadaceae bacterium]|nr:acyltransferase [Selenomonadaceae bacterium]
MKNVSYNCVDLMKYLMVVLVIANHTDPFANISSVGSFLTVYVFTRVAVPYFYVISGYFLFRKMQEDNIDFAKIKKYLLRIFKIYAVWYLIYLPWKLLPTLQNNLTPVLMTEVADFLRGNFYHLYFLHVLIISILLVALLLYMKIGVNKILVIASLFYVFGLFYSSYNGLFEIIFPSGTTFNETFYSVMNCYPYLANAFIYVALGAGIAFRGWHIENKYIIIGLVLSWSLVICEGYFTKYVANWLVYAECYVMLPAAVFLTALLSFKIPLPDKPLWIYLRKMIMYMYLVHLFLLWSLFEMGVIADAKGLKAFIVTLLGSTVISYLLVRK